MLQWAMGGGSMQQEDAMLREAGAAKDFSAVRALAQHLEITPQAIVDWLQHSRGIPPQVLLSLICLWDLKRR
jgi:hypothetical protein